MYCEQCNERTATVWMVSKRGSDAPVNTQLCGECAGPVLEQIDRGETELLMGATLLTEEHSGEDQLPEAIQVREGMTVASVAAALGLRPCQVLGSLFRMNVFCKRAEPLSAETVAALCERYGVRPAT